MSLIRLKAVRCVNPVPFESSTTITLLHTQGRLEYDEESQLVIATPNKPSGIAKAVAIPLGNIVYFEIMDEKLLAAQVAAPKAPNFAEPVKVAPAKDDTIVLRKGQK